LNAYKYSSELELIPFHIIPFEFTLMWTRVEDDIMADTKLFHTSYRSIELLDFNVIVTENWKTAKVSIYDYIDDSDNEKLYPHSKYWQWRDGGDFKEDYENKYTDPYWSFNIIEQIEPSIVNKKWWGLQSYYDTKEFF